MSAILDAPADAEWWRLGDGALWAAGEGLLSKQHLVVIDKTLAEAPEADRDEVEAALLEKAAEFDGASCG